MTLFNDTIILASRAGETKTRTSRSQCGVEVVGLEKRLCSSSHWHLLKLNHSWLFAEYASAHSVAMRLSVIVGAVIQTKPKFIQTKACAVIGTHTSIEADHVSDFH